MDPESELPAEKATAQVLTFRSGKPTNSRTTK